MSLEETESQRKRLLWRACHRGIKEMDLLLGGFAQAKLSGMNAADLAEFTELMNVPDQQFLAWATGQENVPAERQSQLLSDILAFRPDHWT